MKETQKQIFHIQEGVFFMKRISEYLFCWALGGTLYYAVELLFRGYSHWSMFLLGGFCFLFFVWQGLQGGWKTPLWKQVLRCTVFVTSGEFITGIFVNKWMQWNVWDYSDQPFQLFGQICLPFTILFSGLCALGNSFLPHICSIGYTAEEKPQFHVL